MEVKELDKFAFQGTEMKEQKRTYRYTKIKEGRRTEERKIKGNYKRDVEKEL